MSDADMKTITIYDKSRLQPETIDALANLPDLSVLGLTRDEFYAFQTVTFSLRAIKKLKRVDETERPRGPEPVAPPVDKPETVADAPGGVMDHFKD